MRILSLSGLGMLLLASVSPAEDPKPAPLPPELAFIPRDCAGFISLRYDKLNQTPLGKAPIFSAKDQPALATEIERDYLGFPLTEVERITIVYPSFPVFSPNMDYPLFIVTRAKSFDKVELQKKLKAISLRDLTVQDRDDDPKKKPPEAKAKPIIPGEAYLLERKGFLYFLDDRTVAICAFVGRSGIEPILRMFGQVIRADAAASLTPALHEAKDGLLVVGINNEALSSLLALLPGEQRELEPVRKVRGASVVVSISEGTTVRLRFDFPDANLAKQAADAVPKLRKIGQEQLKEFRETAAKNKIYESWSKLIGMASEALQNQTTVETAGSSIVVTTELKTKELFPLIELALLETLANLRNQALKAVSANALKQFALAVHNYEDAYGELPFAKRMHPGLSWRVAILPFIEEFPLSQEFKLDEPWDSAHNKKLIDKMPRLFGPRGDVKVEKGHTFYRSFSGPETIGTAKSFRDITKNRANAIMIVEAGEAVIWTKPDEIVYDPKKPLPKLGGMFADGFHAGFADGSVKFLKKDTDETALRELISINGKSVPKGLP